MNTGGAIPSDPKLYEKAKKIVYAQYDKPSAYRSGALVKKYKEMGGTYKDDGEEETLRRWFKEDWKDVGDKSYPVYRPTKRITKNTPLTPEEIDPKNLRQQVETKQKIKGTKNLKPFKAKGGGIMANSQFYRTDPKRGRGFFDDLQEAMNPTKPKEKTFTEKLADVLKSGINLSDPASITQDQRDKLASATSAGIGKLFDYGTDLLMGSGEKEDIQEAGSAETNPEVKNTLETPMGNEDISAYFPNARYIKYSELKNYRSITDLLPKNGSFFFLLYEHKPNVGHWVLLTRYENKIEYFDSYGLEPCKPLSWNRPQTNAMLGQATPYLSALLKSSELPVVINRTQFQSKKNDSSTCGAWDVLRQLSIEKDGSSLAKFTEKIDTLKKKYGLSGDEIVSNLISKR